jgi:hypothetical protein
MHIDVWQIAAVGKRLAKQLKTLIGPWLCCQFDPASEVRVAAAGAFTVCSKQHPIVDRVSSMAQC